MINILPTAPYQPNAYKQKGAVLVVSLLMLLVLTLLGVNAIRGASLEEKMAYATLDRNVALQSAESSVRAAETFLSGIVSTAALTGTNGLYGINDNPIPDYTNAATWTDPTNHVVATPLDGSVDAKYFIQQNDLIQGTAGSLNLGGYGANTGSGDVTTFRIIARGVGGTANGSEVLLRSHFGRAL